jgi:3-hydroxyisobutyrate dehydrogenase-like beta-hydroxyacid dehydrogenase
MVKAPVDKVVPADVRIALIGYGEVGTIFGQALRKRAAERESIALRTFDRLFDDPAMAQSIRARAVADGIAAADTAAAAVADANLIVCAVTADQTLVAAQSVVANLARGAFYVDMNSASPDTKSRCAAIINTAGGRYVEMAVMTSVPPRGIATPMLSGGPHAAAAAALLAALGFKVEHASDSYGTASAIKMCRSVIIKGMEAIVIESFMAARAYGVDREVLTSLAETFPGIDWEKQGDYFFQRVIQHGRRRAEEMREAAVTVRETGLDPLMASAIAQRQGAVAATVAQRGMPAGISALHWRELATHLAPKT